MALQELPSVAEAYAEAQRGEIAAAVRALRRIWRSMGEDFDPSYRRIERDMLAVMREAQRRVALSAAEYVPAVLDEQGLARQASRFAREWPLGLVGLAGDGRDIEGLLYGAVIRAKEASGTGLLPNQSLEHASKWLTRAAGTALSDTGRQSEALSMGVRPTTGYVRMLNPPSCSRCAILAGKFYRKNTGFPRHPKCDCRHIPSTESLAGDMTVDPRRYFESLNRSQQESIFTQAGATAIREGADVAQVVNARRGMTTSQVGGRRIATTTEGTTRRRRAGAITTPGPRLMPETIGQIATDRADYLRLLGVNGYLG